VLRRASLERAGAGLFVEPGAQTAVADAGTTFHTTEAAAHTARGPFAEFFPFTDRACHQQARLAHFAGTDAGSVVAGAGASLSADAAVGATRAPVPPCAPNSHRAWLVQLVTLMNSALGRRVR